MKTLTVQLPESLVAEIAAVSVTGYREVRFKPYRIIYEVAGRDVLVHCILDGRRALRSLLEQRLLR